MPGHLKNGFSLVEMLIALAVSSIIIAASFGSYTIIARNFEFQKDMKYIAQSARAVVDMMNADIRLAGYTAINNTSINDAVLMSDSGAADCCDAISVIYDQSQTQRRQVTYWTEQFIPGGGTADPTRNRLYKQVCNISNPYTITQIQAGGCTSNILEKNPIADYVQDLQFTGTRGDCVTGSTELGCGTKGKLTATIAGGSDEPVESWQSGTCCSTAYLLDGDETTYWKNGNGRVQFNFASPVRIEYVEISHPAQALHPGNDNGGAGPVDLNTPVYSNATTFQTFTQFKYPYGFNYSTSSHTTWRVNTDQCSSSSNRFPNCKTVSGGDSNLSGTVGEMEGGYIYGLKHKQAWSDGMQGLTQKAELQTGGDAPTPVYSNACFPGTVLLNACIGTNASGYTTSDPGGDVGSPIVGEVVFYGEVYGGAVPPHEIETSILIRSPNEHGKVDRSIGSPLTLGNRTNTWNDKRLRDSYTISTVVRNLFYASQ